MFTYLRRLIAQVWSRDYIPFKGSRLPPHRVRFKPQTDDAFLASAIHEATRVTKDLHYDPADLLVDLGCGYGRLAIGLVRAMPHARYLGLDVSAPAIAWCTTHISQDAPSYLFQHLDIVNARYHPAGAPLTAQFRLPVEDARAGLVYMNGVVTNMEPAHLPIYLREIARILRPGGTVFLTAHIEPHVPPASVNPDGYVPYSCVGPLHVVRYEQHFFLDLCASVGLHLMHLDYHIANSRQSALTCVKR